MSEVALRSRVLVVIKIYSRYVVDHQIVLHLPPDCPQFSHLFVSRNKVNSISAFTLVTDLRARVHVVTESYIGQCLTSTYQFCRRVRCKINKALFEPNTTRLYLVSTPKFTLGECSSRVCVNMIYDYDYS